HLLIFGGDVRGVLAATEPAATATVGPNALHAALDRDVRREDDHVVLRLEITGVDVLREDGRVRNLEILELETRPAARHAAAVTVEEGYAFRRQLLRIGGGTGRRRVEVETELRGSLVDDGLAVRGDVVGARRIRLAVRRHRRLEPVDVRVRLERTVEYRDRVVVVVRKQVALRTLFAADLTRLRLHQLLALDFRRLNVEAVEDAIELHAHRVGERPTGVVVRPLRRTARIREIVRVILRLHHVEDLSARRLRRLDHERTGRIVFAVHREIRGRPLDRHANVAQRVHELDRRREIRLIGRDDVAASVALVLRLEDRVVRRDSGHVVAIAAAIRRSADDEITTGRRRCGCTRTAATATTAAACTTAATRRRPCLLCSGPAVERFFDRHDVLAADRPVVMAALGDRVLGHQVLVVQKRFTITARVVEDRVVRRDRVIDRTAEMPLLRLDRRGEIAARQQLIHDDRNATRRRVADDLGEDADDALEVANGTKTAVPPGRVARARAHREARLVFLEETLMDREAYCVEAHD